MATEHPSGNEEASVVTGSGHPGQRGHIFSGSDPDDPVSQ